MKKEITKELAMKYKELGYPVKKEIIYSIEVPDGTKPKNNPRKQRRERVNGSDKLILGNPGTPIPSGKTGECYTALKMLLSGKGATTRDSITNTLYQPVSYTHLTLPTILRV